MKFGRSSTRFHTGRSTGAAQGAWFWWSSTGERELFPRHFWLITSLAREAFDAETLLKRYRVRGKAEKIFGELKTGLDPQLSSSARPKSHFRGRPIERETEPGDETWRP